MDDFCLEGEANTVAADVENIIKAYVNTGLHLNPAKCEITTRNFDCIRGIQTFSAIKKEENADLVMLGASVMKGRGVNPYGTEGTRPPQCFGWRGRQ